MEAPKGHYRCKPIYHIVYHELIMAARNQGVVTYQEIAKLMGLPLKGNYMGKELGHILGEISEDEVACGRPMLSALAVGVSGKPGENFYAYAKAMGRLDKDAEDTKEIHEQFWEREKAAVYEAWRVDLKE